MQLDRWTWKVIMVSQKLVGEDFRYLWLSISLSVNHLWFSIVSTQCYSFGRYISFIVIYNDLNQWNCRFNDNTWPIMYLIVHLYIFLKFCQHLPICFFVRCISFFLLWGEEALGPPMHSFLWLKFLYDLIITLLAWDSLILNLTFQDVREGSV